MPWPYLLGAFLLLTPVAVWSMRRDYRRRGRLTWLGFGLLLVWFFLPHLTLDYAVRYVTPWTVRHYLGLGLAVAGLLGALWAILEFRSFRKVFARDPGSLTLSGPYRWSRNPQYVGWMVFFVGYAVMWWSPWCWLALGMLALALQILVLVEEEHLHHTFGDAYDAYCRRVPRWFGRPRARALLA